MKVAVIGSRGLSVTDLGARNKADGVPAGIHKVRQERSAETEYHDN